MRALRPDHWSGAAGRRFRATIDVLFDAANQAAPNDIPNALAEGTRRVVIGKVSREYAEALKNFASEEEARISSEFAKRTIDERVRQESAKADQEETRARMMRNDEILQRLVLIDKLQSLNCLPVWDGQGNIRIIRPTSPAVWEKVRELLLSGDDVAASLSILESSSEPGEPKR